MSHANSWLAPQAHDWVLHSAALMGFLLVLMKLRSFCPQITGDPNVPAGKVSFCVSAENARMGTYNGFEREEVGPGVFEDVFRTIGAAPPLCIWTI